MDRGERSDSGRDSEESQENRSPVDREKGNFSRELDAGYLTAAEAGDKDTAQRMVDEAAKAAGCCTTSSLALWRKNGP